MPFSSTPERQNAIEIAVVNHQRILGVDAARLKKLVEFALRSESVERASLSLVFVDDATLHDINRRHLGHDWPTDVVTFDLADDPSEGVIGELVVSAEMAKITATAAGTDPLAELALYVVHGTLHLCGYDDQTEDQIRRIRARERELLELDGWEWTYPRFA